jgi:hypothetical protein
MDDGNTNTCGPVTDQVGTTLITSTFCGDVDNGTSINDLVIFNGGTNSAICEDGATAQYFCCTSR